MTRITLRFYTLTFQALVILLIAAMSFVYGLILLSPKIDLHHYQPYSTAILDKHGRLLSLPLTGDDKYRVKLSFEQIPKAVIDLTLLYEDKDFYHHYGVDFIALFRAFSSTYITKKRRMGASTLTMQVARLRWKINTQSWSGKVNQIFKALQIEHQYSKQDILTAYFNLAPYGGNVEGIGAASFLYFQKSPHQLNPLESIILSVIPQNPNKRNPAKQSSLPHIKQAISRLIERLDSSQFASWLTDAQDLPLLLKRDTTYLNIAPHFTQYIRNNQANYTQPKASVTTSLISNKQRQAMRVVKNYVNRKADVGIANASVIVLNSDTMNIEVMIGSADFFNHKIQGQVNGTLAKRSPGSTLKPFIYGLALDQGLIHPLTILSDSPDQYAGYTRKF